ncbi:MAG: hypothetical protein VZR73_03955 [Acutalibacteraceae bacterium]|nr:hypothetical protein [Acutalibacteraceae bacterium]
MSWTAVNIKSARLCAFCKYWWGPACRYIAPNKETLWVFEPSAKCRCIKRGMDMQAQASCGMFSYKSILADL